MIDGEEEKFKKEGFIVMAQQTPLKDRLRVVYTIYNNQGQEITEEISLNELLAKGYNFTSQISKLTFLPVFNIDKSTGKISSIYTKAKTIDVEIFDNFPNLTHLGYPSQFSDVQGDKIRKRCPNLALIMMISSTLDYPGKLSAPAKIDMGITHDGRQGHDSTTIDELPTVEEIFGQIENVESYMIANLSPKKVTARAPRPVAITNVDIINAVNQLNTELNNSNNTVVQSFSNFQEIVINKIDGFAGNISQEQLNEIILEIKRTLDRKPTIDSEETLKNIIAGSITENFTTLFSKLETKENAKYDKFLEELASLVKTQGEISDNVGLDAENINIIRQKIDVELPKLLANNEYFQNFVYARLGSISNKTTEIDEEQSNFVKFCSDELSKIFEHIKTLSTSEEVKEVLKSAFGSFAQDLNNTQSKFFEEVKKAIDNLPTVETMREMVAEELEKSVGEVNFHTDLVAEHIINEIVNSGVSLSDEDKKEIRKILEKVNENGEQLDDVSIKLDANMIMNFANFTNVLDQQKETNKRLDFRAYLDAKRHDALIAKLKELKVSEDKIGEIIDGAVGKTSIATHAIVSGIVNSAVDKIIESHGRLAEISQIDEDKIKKVVQGFVSSEQFKTFLSEILDSKDIASGEVLSELITAVESRSNAEMNQIRENNDLIRKSYDDIMKVLGTRLQGLAKKVDIDAMISRTDDGEIQGLIPESVRQIVNEEIAKAGLSTKQDVLNFEQTMSQQLKDIMLQLSPVFALIQQNGGIVNNVTNNYTTNNASQEAEDKTPTVHVETAVNTEQVNEMVRNALSSLLSVYIINNAASNNQLQGLGLGNGTNINIQPNIAQIIGLIGSAMAGNNITLQPQTDVNNIAVNTLLQLLIKNMGVQQPIITPNPEVAKLQAEMDALKKKHEAEMDALKKQLDEIKALLIKKDPEPIKKDPEKKEDDPEDKRKPEDKKDPKKEKPEPIKMPEPVGKEKLVSGTIEHLNRIKEPKMPLFKRIGKAIVKHPILAGVIGAGVAVTGLAGVGVVSMALKTGGLIAGVKALGAAIPFFAPTIGIAAGVGAGVPLIGGGIGELISRFSKKSKKERLYAKFLKQKSKCDALAHTIEEKVIAQELAEQKLEEARENQRHGNKLLKKLGVYKRARDKQRKKIRKLRTAIREVENRRDAKVAQALSTKRSLNAMEDADHVSLAMGGHLQKLRKQKEALEAQLASPTLDEEEKQDIQEDIQTVIEDAEDEVAGISTLGSGYKTFDTEAEELIKSVKSKSSSMSEILTEIQSRNSKRTVHTVDRPKFDPRQVEEYIARAKNSKNPQDHANAEKLAAYIEDLKSNKTTLTALVGSRKISPSLARQLMSKGSVEVAPTEVVDIEFKEKVVDPESTKESSEEKTK